MYFSDGLLEVAGCNHQHDLDPLDMDHHEQAHEGLDVEQMWGAVHMSHDQFHQIYILQEKSFDLSR